MHFFKKKIGQLFTRDACNYLSEGVPQSLVAIFIWIVDLCCIFFFKEINDCRIFSQ